MISLASIKCVCSLKPQTLIYILLDKKIVEQLRTYIPLTYLSDYTVEKRTTPGDPVVVDPPNDRYRCEEKTTGTAISPNLRVH